MKIGIIGAGQIGGTLTRRFRAVGHDVTVANSRGPETLADLASETGARAVSLREIARDRDVVVLSIPTNRIGELPGDLLADADPALAVIDTSNYYPRERDGHVAGIEESATESGWVGQRIGRPVVKAFNSIIAQHLLENGKPAGTPKRIALAVSGDDPEAKSTVMKLVEQIGFDPVDAGTIADSWRQQPGTPGYLKDGNAAELRRTLAEATPGRTADWRATPNSPGSYDKPA